MTTSNTTPVSSHTQTRSRWAALITACVLTACGGGGGGSADTGPPPSSTVAQQCSPNNPYVADASQATSPGALSTEKSWVRSYLNEAYLWYDQVPAVDANAASYSNDTPSGYYTSIKNYFEALKTPSRTASGARTDKFSFTYPTKAWNSLAQSGVTLGYGIEWTFASSTPPRGIRIAFVEPGSPAANAGLRRGDTLVSVTSGTTTVAADDGTAAGVAILNAALFPRNPDTFTFNLSRNGVALAALTFTAANVSKSPVLLTSVLPTASGNVGYIVFNDHLAPAEDQLINAINTLKSQNVTDLVLDMRYNGGGYLYIASELAYMIAGPANTYVGANSKIFEKLQYNAKRTADTNALRSTTPFFNTSCILNALFQCTRQQPLPTLGLNRVYVLTSGSTCSASESVINSLRGVGVTVNLVGTTTCGKPYGFTAKDNCGVSYFPIEFKGTNAVGFGDYSDGFAPACAAVDDFSHALGDTAEGKLSAALYMRANSGACLAGVASASGKKGIQSLKEMAAEEGYLVRDPVRENRIVVQPQR